MANNGSVNSLHLLLGPAGKFSALVVRGCPLVSTKSYLLPVASRIKELLRNIFATKDFLLFFLSEQWCHSGSGYGLPIRSL